MLASFGEQLFGKPDQTLGNSAIGCCKSEATTPLRQITPVLTVLHGTPLEIGLPPEIQNPGGGILFLISAAYA
jgi:hypothetical protein